MVVEKGRRLDEEQENDIGARREDRDVTRARRESFKLLLSMSRNAPWRC